MNKSSEKKSRKDRIDLRATFRWMRGYLRHVDEAAERGETVTLTAEETTTLTRLLTRFQRLLDEKGTRPQPKVRSFER